MRGFRVNIWVSAPAGIPGSLAVPCLSGLGAAGGGAECGPGTPARPRWALRPPARDLPFLQVLSLKPRPICPLLAVRSVISPGRRCALRVSTHTWDQAPGKEHMAPVSCPLPCSAKKPFI